MPRLEIAPLAALVVVLSSPLASAQDAPIPSATVGAGTRIRVAVASSLDPFTGVVLSRRADSLIVVRDAARDTIAVPLGQIVRLDVSRGERISMRRGAGVGLATGALVGMVVGAATYRGASCAEDSFFCIDLGPAGDMMTGGAVGGIVGAAVGALIAARSPEIWHPVIGSGDARARLGVAPAGRSGVAMVASLRF